MLISAGNAIIRKAFDVSSNAWLELQWYFFSAVFLLAAAYALQRNDHIRIDIISGDAAEAGAQLDRSARPYLHADALRDPDDLRSRAIPCTCRSRSRRHSPNAGGLIVWPAKALVLAGFSLLALQGVSEIIKRIAVMRGLIPDPHEGESASHAGGGHRTPCEATAVTALLVAEYGADHVRQPGRAVAARLSRRLRARRERAVVRHSSASSWACFRRCFLQALPERIFGIMNNDTLLAIPFFTFMGLILERSGMAEDLLDTVGQLFGPVRGGLAFAVVLVGALLAATTGVVAASVIAMGLISLPIMLRYGYDRRVATGVIAASGTLAQIIPPSLVLIIMADQLGRSVGDMYAGAIIPGLVLTGAVHGLCRASSRCAIRTPLRRCRWRRARWAAGVTSLFFSSSSSPSPPDTRSSPISASTFNEKGIWSATASIVIAYVDRADQSRARPRSAVAAGAAGHHRADAAAGADLPCARHDFPRHRHADRRRRDGRGRRAAAGDFQAPAEFRACCARRSTRRPSCRPSCCSS